MDFISPSKIINKKIKKLLDTLAFLGMNENAHIYIAMGIVWHHHNTWFINYKGW